MTREEAIRELRIQFVGEYDRQREAKDVAIKALEQKTGHWIYYKAINTGEIIWSKCSKCGNEERGCAQRMKYCPECGIKMEEVEE